MPILNPFGFDKLINYNASAHLYETLYTHIKTNPCMYAFVMLFYEKLFFQKK